MVSTMITMVTTSEAMFGWRRTYESSWFPKVWLFFCFVLEDIRRKRSSIADTVAVAEVSVLPLHLQEVLMQGSHQGAAVAKLGAAGGRRGTAIPPLHNVCPEKRFRVSCPIKTWLIGVTPERIGSTASLPCAVAKQASVNEGHDESCNRQNDLCLVPIPHP